MGTRGMELTLEATLDGKAEGKLGGKPALSVKFCAEEEMVKLRRSKPAGNATAIRFMANLT